MNKIERGDISSIGEAKGLIDSTIQAGSSAELVGNICSAVERLAFGKPFLKEALMHLDSRVSGQHSS
ncbi:hypothetical protein [Luteimonas sp. TWI1416]|uniref:hypothetical protein n=1 Tax=unclassified Luteimonas TaxID=2629088 RepID=UPI0032098244